MTKSAAADTTADAGGTTDANDESSTILWARWNAMGATRPAATTTTTTTVSRNAEQSSRYLHAHGCNSSQSSAAATDPATAN